MRQKIDRNSTVLELDGLPEEIYEQLQHVSPHHLEKLLRAIAILVKSRSRESLYPPADTLEARTATVPVLVRSADGLCHTCDRSD
ncbi:MAG: hypothetical protein N5P05_004157 (plasmid) [Chroococcopsis gigantea SAG 12.99]|jgi:hypothetical protein|nr:hypothetical protein [Chroococcopsis gigantea SAG 12.99]